MGSEMCIRDSYKSPRFLRSQKGTNMNPISGAAPVMDAQTMKELMGVAVAAQTQQATKTAIAAAVLKVSNPSTGLDVWA